MPGKAHPAIESVPPESPADRASAAGAAAGGRASAGVRLLLLASVVIWGWTFVAMKVLLDHVTPFELVGLRFAIGLPVLFALVRWKRIPLRFERRDLAPLAFGALVILAHFLIQPIALSFEKTTATNTGWIIAFSPIGIAILSRFVLGERLRANQVAGIATATLGVLVLVSKGDPRSLTWLANVGDWLILFTAFTWGLYTITTRDVSRRRSPLAVTLVVFTPLCAVCLAVIAARSDVSRFAHLPPKALAALLFLGVLGTLAQWFWQLGVARIGAARAGVYVYLEPLATTVLAVPLLKESFGVASAAGGVLLLGGVWWAERTRPAPAGRTHAAGDSAHAPGAPVPEPAASRARMPGKVRP